MKEENARKERVSVVMCTYNGGRYLREQMDSVLAQDYPIFEIIVQDDCSSDGTWDLLESYQKAHPGLFKIFRNRQNMGFNKNFRTAIGRATGDLIAISDQDDIWFPQKIRRQVEEIGGCDLCFSAYDRDKVFSGKTVCHIAPRGDSTSLVFFNIIPGHTMLLRASFAKRGDVWKDDFYYDWWFLIKATFDGNGTRRVAEPLNWHRPHAQSAIAKIREKGIGRKKMRNEAWAPYIFGWKAFSGLRKLEKWREFYQDLWQLTDNGRFPLEHSLCAAMLRKGAPWRLCLLCLRNRKAVYPGDGRQGKWRQMLRAFCYPAIYAYGNTSFCI